MSGFSPRERAVLQSSLARADAHPRWRVCAFGDADAWWINGAKARLTPEGNLKVAAGLPTERALHLNLGEIDRPVAFALPLTGDEFEPRFSFDPVSEPSIHAVLLEFDSWLWRTRAEFVLGAHIVLRTPDLRRGVYQVSRAGKLLAVVDFQQGQAAILPRVHPDDLWDAQWDRRSVGDWLLPESFVQVTPTQLAWAYVRRTDRDMLPPRYRTHVIYYRQVPGVPLRWLRDSQLLLLRELSAEPASLDALRQRTGLPVAHAEYDLTCLYYAGAITTTPTKAAVPRAGRQDSQPNSMGPGLDSLMRNDADAHYRSDLTAPAQLEPRRKSPPDSS